MLNDNIECSKYQIRKEAIIAILAFEYEDSTKKPGVAKFCFDIQINCNLQFIWMSITVCQKGRTHFLQNKIWQFLVFTTVFIFKTLV